MTRSHIMNTGIQFQCDEAFLTLKLTLMFSALSKAALVLNEGNTFSITGGSRSFGLPSEMCSSHEVMLLGLLSRKRDFSAVSSIVSRQVQLRIFRIFCSIHPGHLPANNCPNDRLSWLWSSPLDWSRLHEICIAFPILFSLSNSSNYPLSFTSVGSVLWFEAFPYFVV